MKQAYIYLFLIFGVLFSCNTTKNITKNYDVSIYRIKEKYAPDSRVAVFDIETIKKGEKVLLKGETNIPEAKSELLRDIAGQGLTYIDSIKLLPEEKLGKNIYGVVRLSVCNMRSHPKHSAELSTQALLGTPVNVLKEEKGWYYIQTTDGYLGWADDASIALYDSMSREEWMKSTKVIFKDVYGFVYSKPDENSGHISDIVEGGILKLIGESLNKKFWIVAFPDERIGYLKKENAEKSRRYLARVEFSTGYDILQTAKELMGIPYLWGGTSAKMMDCSGFTKTVFFMHGILLPRDASQQVNIGKKIKITKDFSRLKPGDLLFFGVNRRDGSERITHVAIYMGDGKIIHETGEVKIQSLKKGDPDFVEYRLKTLKQARRIIGYKGKYGIVGIEKQGMR